MVGHGAEVWCALHQLFKAFTLIIFAGFEIGHTGFPAIRCKGRYFFSAIDRGLLDFINIEPAVSEFYNDRELSLETQGNAI